MRCQWFTNLIRPDLADVELCVFDLFVGNQWSVLFFFLFAEMQQIDIINRCCGLCFHTSSGDCVKSHSRTSFLSSLSADCGLAEPQRHHPGMIGTGAAPTALTGPGEGEGQGNLVTCILHVVPTFPFAPFTWKILQADISQQCQHHVGQSLYSGG